jgi:hypothetical protein
MATDPLYNRLLELSWRRKLTEAEDAELRAWMAAHPELQNDWELESSLTEGLGHLPEVPVGSNFTARVLGQLAKEQVGARRRGRSWIARLMEVGWLPQTAAAAILLGIGLGGYHFQQVRQERAHRREQVARSMAELSRVRAPSTKALQDFDAILALSASPSADEKLLTLLQ